MIPTGPPRGMRRWGKRSNHRGSFGLGQPLSQEHRRIDSIPQLSRNRPRNRHERQSGKPVLHGRGDQVCVVGQPAVLEVVHEGPSWADMFKSGYQPNANPDKTIVGRYQQTTTLIAEKPVGGKPMTRLADHVCNVRRPRDGFALPSGAEPKISGFGPYPGHVHRTRGVAHEVGRARCLPASRSGRRFDLRSGAPDRRPCSPA